MSGIRWGVFWQRSCLWMCSAKSAPLPWRALGLAACCFLAMFGSVLTVGRELLSDYQQWSAEDIALAEFVDINAESDALFLTSDSHLTPVFALAGRRILCGSGSYVYYHGMDYSDEYSAMKALYEAPGRSHAGPMGRGLRGV